MTEAYTEAGDVGVFAPAGRPRSRHRSSADFPVGTRVRVVCDSQDWQFFAGGMKGPTGEVVANSHRYLGIRVRFDKPRWFHKPDPWGSSCPADGCTCPAHAYDHREHGFQPSDLIIEGEVLQ